MSPRDAASPRSRSAARAPTFAVFLSLLSMLTAAGATACSRAAGSEPDVRIASTLLPDPPVMGPATVDVVLTDPSGQPIQGASVRVEGNMSHAGMVPSIASVNEVEPGHHRAALELTMAGDWFLLVHTRLGDGRTVERTVRVPSVRAR